MTRVQAVTIALLGAWVGGTLFMWYVAAGNFAAVDRVLGSPSAPFSESTEPLGAAQTRVVLRHLVSEQNRAYFAVWGWAQVALGALLVLLLWRQTPRDTTALAIVGSMLGVVILLLLVVTPQIVALGRSLDFVPRHPPPPQMGRFRMLHGAFTALDGAKLLAGLGLVARWIGTAR